MDRRKCGLQGRASRAAKSLSSHTERPRCQSSGTIPCDSRSRARHASARWQHHDLCNELLPVLRDRPVRDGVAHSEPALPGRREFGLARAPRRSSFSRLVRLGRVQQVSTPRSPYSFAFFLTMAASMRWRPPASCADVFRWPQRSHWRWRERRRRSRSRPSRQAAPSF